MIAIIGNGSWATALLYSLSYNCSNIYWWVRKEEDIKYIKETSHNPRYLKDIKLNLDVITIHSNLQYVIDQSDIIIIAIPSQYISETFHNIDLKNKIIINASKGIIPDTPIYFLISEYFERRGVDRSHYITLSGPSHAEETVLNKPTYLALTSLDFNLARKVKHILEPLLCNSIILHTSYDVEGIELAGVIKNIYAIGMGIISEYGENLKAAYLSNCAREMTYILNTLYPGAERDILSSPYLGDLLVTSYSSLSRNYRFGEIFSKGNSLEDAKRYIGQEVAGITSAKCFWIKYIDSRKILLQNNSIIELIHEVLFQQDLNRDIFISRLLKLLV